MTTTSKNIFLLGKTGNGKSTLANVLTDTNEFNESADGISETKGIRKLNFEIDTIKYSIFDSIGISDTKLDHKTVLFRLGEIAHSIDKEGLNQIFFVTSGRFTNEEKEAYKLLASIIFDKNVFNYTTIIKTNFPEFEKLEACERDITKLCEESEELNEIFSHTKIIHIDNPPLLGRSAVIELNKETRELSRKRLITYLGTIIHKNYYPTNLKELNERIRDHMTEKEKLEKEIQEREQKIKELFEIHKKELEKFQKEMEEKAKSLEIIKNEKIKEIESRLSEEIKNMKRKGEINEARLSDLKIKSKEEKERREEEFQKNLNELKEENEKMKNKNDELSSQMASWKNEIKNLGSRVSELVEKVNNEVNSKLRNTLEVSASIGAGAASGAIVGSFVPLVGTAIGAGVGTAAAVIFSIFRNI